MTQRFFTLLILVTAVSVTSTAHSKELVQRFTGNRSTETPEFEVQAPWIIDWLVNGEYPQMVGLEVSLIDASTGHHAGYILKTKYVGNGVRLFDEPGIYRLKVNATLANWILKVEQLTPEEAALYTPKADTD